MTTGPHRKGRRDNGLHASEYAVAGDVDPRVGEHLLDVLGLAGIAAYLQPTADLHPVTRTTTLPSRPIDRLYVDRDHLTEARGYLDQLGPAAVPSTAATGGTDPTATPAATADPTAPSDRSGRTPGGTDIDSAWAAIIADFDSPGDDPVPPWPVAEDLPDDRRGDRPVDRPDGERPAAGDAGTGGTAVARPGGDWRADPNRPDLLDSLDAELDDEGYDPPPPPPIPRPSWYAVLAVAAIALGLLICIRPDVLGYLGIGRTGGLVAGFGCLVGGFVILVIRLRPGTDEEDDDTDDGAVV